MHPRRPMIRVGLATSAFLLAVAAASMWIGVGFSDTALITCATLDVHAEPVSFSEFGVWWINPAATMKDRLRSAFGLPRVESYLRVAHHRVYGKNIAARDMLPSFTFTDRILRRMSLTW